MLYLLTTGCPWRQLPHSYPHWKSVYRYFRFWQQDGTWKRLHNTLRAQVRRQAGRHKHPTAGSLDSQSIKSSHVPGCRGFDRGKLVSGRKRHLIVDTLGLLLAVRVTPASVSETAGGVQVLRRLDGSAKKLRLLWLDDGYFNSTFEQAHRQRIELRPVLRPPGLRAAAQTLGCRAHLCLALALPSPGPRLETSIQSSEAFILLAMSRLMLRRLAPQ